MRAGKSCGNSRTRPSETSSRLWAGPSMPTEPEASSLTGPIADSSRSSKRSLMKYLSQGKTPYSKGEQTLFSLMPKDGTEITSAELARLREEQDGGWRVDNPRRTVLLQMKTLMRKVTDNKEAFRIKKGKQRGPYPVWFKIEDRQKWRTPRDTKGGSTKNKLSA